MVEKLDIDPQIFITLVQLVDHGVWTVEALQPAIRSPRDPLHANTRHALSSPGNYCRWESLRLVLETVEHLQYYWRAGRGRKS